ncbi:TPR-like protein [Dioscorea alata]|uniref:TPR-like protein n=1 Tax=Dioscorea alata TaxID=55571 RepID=A0ACB7WA00_DIOAL|nr:TPR-like protein [Dioscorea alata]
MAASLLRLLRPPLPSPSRCANHFKSFTPRRTEDMALLPFRKDVAKFSQLQCLSSSKIICSTLGISHMAGSCDAYAFDRKNTGVCKATLDCVSDHQNMASFSFSKVFLVANSFMLFLPLNALAETCEPENSFLSMPLLFIIALIGATVGGLLARQRRGELKRLNDQLRQINAALRRQAKIESYAPNLSYAPVGRVSETEVIVDPRKQQLITNLRTGKNYLRNQDPEKALAEFNAAFELAETLGDHVEEKKAARGLGASFQRLGKYKEAIKYHSKVLEISKRAGEDSGSTEAYGAIADCYTELGDLEKAGKFYDKYIGRLQND